MLSEPARKERIFSGQDNRENLSVAELHVRLSYDRVWHDYDGLWNYEIKLKRSGV